MVGRRNWERVLAGRDVHGRAVHLLVIFLSKKYFIRSAASQRRQIGAIETSRADDRHGVEHRAARTQFQFTRTILNDARRAQRQVLG